MAYYCRLRPRSISFWNIYYYFTVEVKKIFRLIFIPSGKGDSLNTFFRRQIKKHWKPSAQTLRKVVTGGAPRSCRRKSICWKENKRYIYALPRFVLSFIRLCLKSSFCVEMSSTVLWEKPFYFFPLCRRIPISHAGIHGRSSYKGHKSRTRRLYRGAFFCAPLCIPLSEICNCSASVFCVPCRSFRKVTRGREIFSLFL